ncbi:hypothetical protein CGZ94_11890 [Enemella evansiae]|uniref:Type IV toxin-antitoxin system AbiEi family antitoxin domain-containing protein n=1 Tax=Enemella evansiae TaxID=2016499 RepID=A0A255GDI4_9ACTN|nr:type IV toxin-antitoxin system AbiEi family antitoxin domain-containing protein [Enemella evansiae]OYO13651.1 hypothetical protein CGZ94_11890 [Enemella evansiae]
MLIRTAELLDEGLCTHEIRALVRKGELTRVRNGVYWRAGFGEPDELDRCAEHLRRIDATLPRVRPGGVLSHLSAAIVHELPVPERRLGPVHITRPGHGGKVRAGMHLHRALVPAEHQRQTESGVVTSLEWTAADLARSLPAVHAVAALDVALAKGADRDEILAILARPHLTGSIQARRLVRFANPASESVGESHSRWLIHELGLPEPELQKEFFTPDGEFVARCDFYWERYNLVGEFDGLVKYGRKLKPGQSVQDVVLFEKHREEAIRRQGPWMSRWIWKDLDDRQAFGRLLTRAFELADRAA